LTRIGIYGVSVQSGKAYLADILAQGIQVYGYARPSEHGRETVQAIERQGGIELHRPPNSIEDTRRFVPLGQSAVGHDLGRLVDQSDLIIIAHPASYHEETVWQLCKAGLGTERRIPIVLSPSRTLATPYLWRLLGEGYPIVSFPTCPYSCKSYEPGSIYIKRRKRFWVGSIEGDHTPWTEHILADLFPQMLLSRVPATTSLGNIGAVFHPATYLLNRDQILAARAEGRGFSFYVEGIVQNPEAARVVGEIDQVRLRIAQALGCPVFGLEEAPHDDRWAEVMARVSALQASTFRGLQDQRRQRAACYGPVRDAVVSAQHWLDYTYGVHRIPGESVRDAIARTPTYQERSHPQERYVYEDIPTGLVPLESLARRLGVAHEPLTRIIDLYEATTGASPRKTGRNLELFETEYLKRYLVGDLDLERRAHEEKLHSGHPGERSPHPGSVRGGASREKGWGRDPHPAPWRG
jgi:opine dehydrogenase